MGDRSPHTRENPPAKKLTREQVEAKQEKAVQFLRDVVGENEVGQTGKTGFELADEIEGLDADQYAERKGITLLNPSDHQLIEHVLSRQLPSWATREERQPAIEAARGALEELPPTAGEVEKLSAVCDAVAAVVEAMEKHKRQEEERQRRQLELEIAQRKRTSLIESAKQRVSLYLLGLYQQGEIERDDWLHPDQDLMPFVEDGLRDELTGSETYEEAQEVAEALVDEFLFEEEEEPEEEEPEEEEAD